MVDIPRIVEMGLHFAGSDYARYLRSDSESISAFAASAMSNPEMTIFVAEHDHHLVGMLGGMVYVHPMSGERTGVELCWWMEPQARGGRDAIRLVRAFEQWASDLNAAVLQLVSPNTHVGEFYATIGYQPVETTYQRRVPCRSAPPLPS